MFIYEPIYNCPKCRKNKTRKQITWADKKYFCKRCGTPVTFVTFCARQAKKN